jgi:hypothetical protein
VRPERPEFPSAALDRYKTATPPNLEDPGEIEEGDDWTADDEADLKVRERLEKEAGL